MFDSRYAYQVHREAYSAVSGLGGYLVERALGQRAWGHASSHFGGGMLSPYIGCDITDCSFAGGHVLF